MVGIYFAALVSLDLQLTFNHPLSFHRYVGKISQTLCRTRRFIITASKLYRFIYGATSTWEEGSRK